MAARHQLQTLRNHPNLQRFLIENARPTGRQLGAGSYGSVEELEVSGVVCAGKKTHETLIEQGKFGVENVASRYVEEYQLMSDLRHPHLVQFLGVCFLPNSTLPVLVMERLLTNLDDLLKHNPDIPLSLKRSILADVAKGLVYLHSRSPPVIHRDLTAKNVLLNSAMVAKITDLGNARIVNFKPGQLTRTLSRIPGTMVYMPPEAFENASKCGPSLDSFSFGHLSLFTITQVFPGTLLQYTYRDPENPRRLLGRTEVQRRDDYIKLLHQQLGDQHPLVLLVKQCLDDEPLERPSAQELLQRLEGMRTQIRDPYHHLTKLDAMRMASSTSRQELEALQTQMEQLQLEYSSKVTAMATQLTTKDAEISRLGEKMKSFQKSTDSRGYPSTTTKEGLFSPSCLRGVDKIIDEIEFVLTDEAGSYEWTDGGFKLDTPCGALPAGAVPCQINVRASLSGQFEFPENSELVSSIYWISTPKNLRFSKPLTVHVQHCSTVENRDDSDLSFVVAKCTQPALPYKFKFLDDGLFVPYSSYGSISVTHFSGLGIVSKLQKYPSYCARTYVTSRGRDEWRVYFVIVKDLDVVLKAVNTHYSCFARRDVTLRIIFKKSEISLDIPREGQLISKGWKILPRSYPSISKRDADEFRSGQWIPECELVVEWERSGQCPVRLRHQVSLIGAKAPKNYFYIAINPEWEEPVSRISAITETDLSRTHQKELCLRYPAGLEEKPELCDLMNEVAAKIPSKWRQFGIELQLTSDELDGFLLANFGDTLRCFSSVFTCWQKRMSREPYSWLTVVESLKAPAVGEHRLAQELNHKFSLQLHSDM